LQSIIGSLTLIVMVGLVIARVQMLKRHGVAAMQFGKLDRTDFLIPPFALFYFYLVFAHAFGWPSPAQSVLFESAALGWLGVILCLLGLGGLAWSLDSFGRSFRVGIDTTTPGSLVTTGVFAFSRNPIYTAFAFILLGEFLIFPNWILLLYLVAAVWLFHRQVLREEEYMKEHYGADYAEYCRKVRRYL
jgi:protein-S-isoprenylcysteine O-methyltransferase Ste14